MTNLARIVCFHPWVWIPENQLVCRIHLHIALQKCLHWPLQPKLVPPLVPPCGENGQCAQKKYISLFPLLAQCRSGSAFFSFLHPLLLQSRIMNADHGILSGRGIPARRTRAMRTWVPSIVIGYTIICTKIAILALGDWILSQVPITRLVGDNKINDWKMFPDSQDHLGGVQPLQHPG